MARFRWNRVGALVIVIAAGLLITTMVRAPSGQRPSAEITDPGFDGVAADIADPTARSTLLDHEESLRRQQLESMRCEVGDEAYRIIYESGLTGRSDDRSRIVEVQVWSASASLVERTFNCSKEPDDRGVCAWRRSRYGKIPASSVIAVREALTAALKARAAPQVDHRSVDASRVFVEACRNNRYHFFTRTLDLDNTSGAAGVVLLARNLLHLTRRDQTRQ